MLIGHSLLCLICDVKVLKNKRRNGYNYRRYMEGEKMNNIDEKIFDVLRNDGYTHYKGENRADGVAHYFNKDRILICYVVWDDANEEAIEEVTSLPIIQG